MKKLKKKNLYLEINNESFLVAIAKGNRVEFRGFGVFSPSNRHARTARNPKTGEKIQVEKTIIPTFRMAKTFFEKINR